MTITTSVMNSSNSNLEKIYAFDYLRAISCIFVIALHSNISCIFEGYQRIHSFLIYNVFDLAVPLFFQISLILFFLKRESQPDYFRKKRLFKLLKLYIFWGLFFQLFSLTLQLNKIYLISIKDLMTIQINIQEIIIFIISNGNSIFYFLFSLFLMTALAELFVFSLEINQKNKHINPDVISYILLILSCVILFSLPLIHITLGEKFSLLTKVENPFNFIPYIFSSFLISKSLSQKEIESNYNLNSPQIWSLIILFFCFFFIEWGYFNQPIWVWISDDATKEGLPIYSRVSLVLCSWLITVISFKITSSPPFLIKLISNFSLGIYCLHTFLILSIIRLFPEGHYPYYVYYLIFFAIFIFTIYITKIMRNFQIFQDII
ncbi:acyltransferase family protein [Anabaena cylindrica UHCC 0172]|uniref:acyltransferase family protein n=1 Tax=Anabaena cylindrica TaxID=1165 RepID=UPI002B215BE4|nr:acyltransferase family protein [Anabaena cylindrica]MEA5549585.1 acyltransferase family protein [Anabaena cylindrica UHCC 0172]